MASLWPGSYTRPMRYMCITLGRARSPERVLSGGWLAPTTNKKSQALTEINFHRTCDIFILPCSINLTEMYLPRHLRSQSDTLHLFSIASFVSITSFVSIMSIIYFANFFTDSFNSICSINSITYISFGCFGNKLVTLFSFLNHW